MPAVTMGVFRQVRRAAQIFWALGRRNLFWGLYRDLYQGRLANQDCGCKADRRVARRAARLREALEELGPTFVKLGQVLSRRPDLAPRVCSRSELPRVPAKAPFRSPRSDDAGGGHLNGVLALMTGQIRAEGRL